MTQRIIICHGLDTRSPDYAKPLIERLDKILMDIPHEITALYVGDIFQAELNSWNAKLATNPLLPALKAHSERSWMGQFVGDQYQFDNYKEELMKQIDEVKGMRSVHVVAHSWGCVFAFTDLIPQLDGQCQSLTLHGSPLDLYRLKEGIVRYNFEMPTDNFFHPMDFIGGPMSHASNATDHVITDAGPNFDIADNLQSFIQIHQSHGAGWYSAGMAECIAAKVRATAELSEKKGIPPCV